MSTVYNKLVRDKIPAIIERTGKEPITRVANEEEYLQLLKSKLNEEVKEFQESENPEELADILEVLISLSEGKGLDWLDIEKMAVQKRQERGAFKNKIILVEVRD